MPASKEELATVDMIANVEMPALIHMQINAGEENQGTPHLPLTWHTAQIADVRHLLIRMGPNSFQ